MCRVASLGGQRLMADFFNIPIAIYIPRDYTKLAYKVTIKGTDVTTDVLNASFNRGLNELTGSLSLTLDNSSGTYTGLYIGGETVNLYADFGSASTLIWSGYIDKFRQGRSATQNTVVISGYHIGEALDNVHITQSWSNSTVETIISNIIAKSDQSFAYSSTASYYNDVNGNAIKNNVNKSTTISFANLKCKQALAQALANVAFDFYIDNSKNVVVFSRNSIQNPPAAISVGDAIVYNDSVIPDGSDNLGFDRFFESNYIRIEGQDKNSIPILYHASSQSSIASFGKREQIVSDPSITSMSQAQTVGNALLTGSLREGTADCHFLVTVNPGEQIRLSDPINGYEGWFRITEFTHTFDQTQWTTKITINLVRKLPNVFKVRYSSDTLGSSNDNPNDMTDSFNWTFTDSTNIVTLSNLTISNGSLGLSSGATSGTFISSVLKPAFAISVIELRTSGTDLGGITFSYSTDGGQTYNNITANVLINVSATSIVIKATYSNTSPYPAPNLSSFALLYK